MLYIMMNGEMVDLRWNSCMIWVLIVNMLLMSSVLVIIGYIVFVILLCVSV